jgi:hypothetical protein
MRYRPNQKPLLRQSPQRPNPKRRKIFLVAGEENGDLGFAEVVANYW